MKLNCKEGDLAVVVRSATGKTVGQIVACVKLARIPGLYNADRSLSRGAVWETDWYHPTVTGGIGNFVMDADLRPLRDNPGEDETLTWAPRKEPVAA